MVSDSYSWNEREKTKCCCDIQYGIRSHRINCTTQADTVYHDEHGVKSGSSLQCHSPGCTSKKNYKKKKNVQREFKKLQLNKYLISIKKEHETAAV